MKPETKLMISQSIQDFHLPRYNQIPNVGLYLDQVTKYICEYLAPLQENAITGSMISNYVKKGLLSNPVKKQYSRDQIAYLMFIALAKSVLSLDSLTLLIRLQQRTYSTERAYEYLCNEFENILQHVFGLKQDIDTVGIDSTDEKFMLRATIITIAHKIYLEKCFAAMTAEE
ncbi:MAG: DUF1836 domain-containing protein [Oscillospiraceae bacterium]|nr:DUF1836 domain-containing protein [Oscillospiraceae bacterium]